MLNDFAGAAKDAETILSLDPNGIEGLFVRGVARTGLEQFRPALTDLEEVLKRAPALAAAWAARGNVKYHLGDATAMADYREAFRLDAASATRVTVRLLKAQATSRPTEVLAECQKFRARDRNDVISLARRGLTRLLQNRPTDANLDFNTFRKLAPGDVKILDMLIAAVTKGTSK